MEVRARELRGSAAAPSLVRAQDLLLTLAAGLAAIVVAHGRTGPGWGRAVAVYLGLAAMPWAFRALQRAVPGTFTRFLATFVPPTAGVILLYSWLDPVADLLNPHLADARLAALDLQLFGLHPGIWLEQHLPPPALDALLVCYTSYYFWPVSIGLILFAQRREAELDRFILGYVLVMLACYVGYLAMPAIGPRFYLVDQYPGPLAAGPLGRWLEALFRGAPYFRDCFPSGHTALTLYGLVEARRLTPRWFKVMLGPAIGLIVATLACRFHYAVDLLCAPLWTVGAIAATEAIHAWRPLGASLAQRAALVLGRNAR